VDLCILQSYSTGLLSGVIWPAENSITLPTCNRISQVVIVQEDVLVLCFLQANVLFGPKTSSPRVEECVGREVEDVLCLQTAYAWGVWQEDPQ